MGNPITIPFVKLLTPEKELLGDVIFQKMKTVFSESRFILGAEVEEFEAAFARLAGCAFAVGVNSGLDALLLALRASSIGEGDEVITPPNSFIASAAAIALVGARPVFADVGWDYNIDPEQIARVISPRTKAILPVHLTGNPCAMDRILCLARENSLLVIEDAAQAVGATYQGQLTGSFGDFGCFSLHPLKNLHVWGDGGVITIQSKDVAQQLQRQRNHGLRDRDESEFFSYNSRLDTVQAVVGLASLQLFEETTGRRIRNAELYRERLAGVEGIVLPPWDREKARPVYHVFQIRARSRDRLKAWLAERGVETKIHYPNPMHLQKASSHLGYGQGDFPVTEHLAKEILSLPVRENLSADELHHICDSIESFYRA